MSTLPADFTTPITDHDFVALRRRLHAAPELGYQEHQTGAIVAHCLRDWGYEVETGVGRTGVVGTLRNGPGERSIGIRADMDALPITEATGLPYASGTPGIMHACGHDGHTTILLAAARELAQSRQFSGTLRVIFQPAEEDESGACAMIADGLFERFPVDAVFALHNWPGLEAGQLAFIDGPAMASVDMFIIKIHGQGGHGAKPHQTVDPVVASASLVMALQTLVSRNADPLEMAVVTVGSIHGGIASNVIPEMVQLEITTRAFNPAVRQMIKERLVALAEGHAQSFGARAEIFNPPGYPVLINHAEETAFARDVARRHFGDGRVDPTFKPMSVSEDFAFMLEQRRGSYLFVGNGPSADLHSAKYDFNDAVIPEVSRYWVRLVEDYLAANQP
jgi:hippurate hydrolase